MDPEAEALRHVEGLVKASGLSLTRDEIATLAATYGRFERQRSALSEVTLDETEPALTIRVASA